MEFINRLTGRAVKRQASDLHLIPGSYPALRVDNRIVFVEDEPLLDKDRIKSIIDHFLNDQQGKFFLKNKKITLSYVFEGGLRARINISFQKGLPAIYIRFIPLKIRTISELGLPKAVSGFTDWDRGLIIITGPFNSGRSATAAALINEINRKSKKYIITLEEPIEYVFTGNKSIIEQIEIGVDSRDYKEALLDLSRRDVDIVFIDKMEREEETKEVLLVAQGNALVVSILNTDSSITALEKIIYSFSPAERAGIQRELSDCLRAILVQRLLPKIGGGMVLVYEVLIVNQAIKLLISEGNLNQIDNILQTSRDEGMVAFDQKLAELVGSGKVSREEAQKKALNPEALKSLLH